MASFDIVLQTGGSLHPGGEPDDYIAEYAGLIRCTRDRDGSVFKVGKVKAYRIHAGLAADHGESVFEVCDCRSQPMHDLYAALFDPAQDDLKEEIRSQFDGVEADVLVLDYVLLAPRWRGLKLGLLAARKLIDLLGGGCGLTVADIAPLNTAWIPLGTINLVGFSEEVMTDPRLVEALQQQADKDGQTVRLVKFIRGEEVQVVRPRP
jgi:hypothetical protein